MNNDKNGSLRQKKASKQRPQPKENLADKLVQARGSEPVSKSGTSVKQSSQYETVVKQLNDLVSDFHRDSTVHNNKTIVKKVIISKHL